MYYFRRVYQFDKPEQQERQNKVFVCATRLIKQNKLIRIEQLWKHVLTGDNIFDGKMSVNDTTYIEEFNQCATVSLTFEEFRNLMIDEVEWFQKEFGTWYKYCYSVSLKQMFLYIMLYKMRLCNELDSNKIQDLNKAIYYAQTHEEIDKAVRMFHQIFSDDSCKKQK
jgi:hypothetical protein